MDPNVYVDTSCYGPRALDSLVRQPGVDQLVLGSDRPGGEPIRELLASCDRA